MAHPNRLREIEKQSNESLETLIPRILNDKKTVPAAAQQLGVSFKTLWLWVVQNGYRKEVQWVKELPIQEESRG